MQNTLTIEDLKKEGVEFVVSLAKGDFVSASARFDPALKNAQHEAKLRESWKQLESLAGAVNQVAGSRTENQQGFQIVYVTCQFAQGTFDVRLVFNDKGLICGVNFVPTQALNPYRPPAYVDQAAFKEQEVTVGDGEWALPGTLSMPEGGGPFPGVVLVHGSGPQDRDESIGPNKTFRDLAWGLASSGVAVMRYDKRTFAHKEKYSKETAAKVTSKEEVTDDALKAVILLRNTPNIDPKQVFLLGHSLGATLAPRIGVADPAIAGLIVMAGTTRSLEDAIWDQVNYIYSLSDSLTEERKTSLETLKAQVARAKDPNLTEETPSKELPLGMPAQYLLDFRGYHPEEIAKTLAMPILVLQGGRDYQVTAAQDFETWKTALHDRPDTTFILYPKLNHLFIEGEGKPTPQEYSVEGHMNEAVVKTIADWIREGPRKTPKKI